MKIPQPEKVRSTDIDMVPMINFAFLLLIFFMLTGSIASGDALGVHPPASVVETNTGDSPHVLLVAADGRLQLAGQPLNLPQLGEAATAWRAQHIGELLQVKADATAGAARVVEVFEILRAAGIERVSLLTVKPQE